MILYLIVAVLTLLYLAKLLYPPLSRYWQLKRDYESISTLTQSRVPFLGNVPQLAEEPYLVFRLFARMSKECQAQNKRAYCLWVATWPMVVFCSAKGLETFINNTKQLVKSSEYSLLEPWLKTGLLTSNGEKWRSRRRLITPSFHDTQLLHRSLEIFNKQARVLAHRFEQFAQEPHTAQNLYPYISACTLDVIAEAATGTQLQAQADGDNNEVVHATMRVGLITTIRMRVPYMWPNLIFNRLAVGQECAKLLKILHGFSRKIIEERLATFDIEQTKNREDSQSGKHLAFLDSLIAQMHQEKLTIDDIQEEVDTFMFEGHDTTAAAISFCCYLVGYHPEVQAKIHAELDSIFGDERERACSMEDIDQMKYLDCVIKESMRILPPVPAVAREVQEDFMYCGTTIRKGTTVLIHIYGIHHDANIYPNPEKFDPERFANDSATSNERPPFAYIPFSAGSRNCIGQRFAGLEDRVVLSTLFRQFRFRSTQTIDELRLAGDVVLRSRVPLLIHVERR